MEDRQESKFCGFVLEIEIEIKKGSMEDELVERGLNKSFSCRGGMKINYVNRVMQGRCENM